MSNKEMVIEAIREMPDEASLEEILEEVAILAAVRRGEEDAAAGRVTSHQEMRKRVEVWIGK